jgi:enamine deaminase RidA (YjgF/YER057c/UK114 family)
MQNNADNVFSMTTAKVDCRQDREPGRDVGQGGWDDDLQIPEAIEDEIAAAFRIIELVLAKAGASWDHVVHVNSYHVGRFPPIVNETIVRLYREYMPDHAPIWTQVGVEALGLPAMHFEIRVTAIIH